MGIILGVLVCIFAPFHALFYWFTCYGYESGSLKNDAHPSLALVWFAALEAFGALLIYSHYHSIW